MQAKKYIICGVPRSGKSALSHKIMGKIGCSHIPIDPLMTAFATKYPGLGITLTMDCDESIYFYICKIATVFWIEYINALDKEFDSYIVEGFHVDIDMIAQVFGHTHTIVVVGFAEQPYEEKIAAIKKYDTSSKCRTYDLGYEALVKQTKWFCHLSHIFKQKAKTYNLLFMDTSYNFEEVLEKTSEELCAVN